VQIGFGVTFLAFLIDLVYRNDPIGVDFHTYLAAARVAMQQGWSHIYDQQLVAVEQVRLVPYGRVQPFISTPPVAWLAVPFSVLPYKIGVGAWAMLTFGAFALALAWSSVSTGVSRWIAVFGALAPWWVLFGVNVGQVVPLVAASTVIGWRLLRDKHDVAAGVVLVGILLKPNTAFLVPAALLFAGRFRAFIAWACSAGAIGLVAFLMLGTHGMTAYMSQLTGTLPSGADNLTLHGALGVTGGVAMGMRILLIGGVLTAAYRLRSSELFVPIAIVGSLLVSPYLHGSDLVLLSAAGWMVWEERPSISWRVPVAIAWILASPFLDLFGLTPHLNRWPYLEFVLFVALIVAAWRPLTAPADLRTRAPA
jgi:hypothetical protein